MKLLPNWVNTHVSAHAAHAAAHPVASAWVCYAGSHCILRVPRDNAVENIRTRFAAEFHLDRKMVHVERIASFDRPILKILTCFDYMWYLSDNLEKRDDWLYFNARVGPKPSVAV